MKCETCGQELPVDEMTFGGRLRRSRVLAGLTAKEVGQKMGYKGGSQITRWEEGSTAMPDSVKTVTRLADLVGCEFLYLMMGTTPPVNQIDGQESLDVTHEGPTPLLVDWDGPVDRASRPTLYTDGSKIPLHLRPKKEG